MRYCLTLFTALTLVIPAYGVVPIPYVSEGEIQLDGQLDDWSEVLGPPLLTASDFHLWQGAPMHEKPLYVDFDPANLDFRIWLGWRTPGRVFVAAEFTDDIIRDDGSPLFHGADGLVIAVTPDSRERAHSYAVRPAGYIVQPFPDVGNNAARWSVNDPFAHAVRAEQTPTSWGVEFFISCFDVLQPSDSGDSAADESVVTDLAAGDEVDLTLSVTDWDADERRSAWFYLAPEDASSVRAVLLSPGDTAVRQQTWGEVKALSETE